MAAFDTSKPGESPSFFDGDSEDSGEHGHQDAGFGADDDFRERDEGVGGAAAGDEYLEYDDPNDWEECQDDDGNVFWYQISTGESSWDAPVFGPALA